MKKFNFILIFCAFCLFQHLFMLIAQTQKDFVFKLINDAINKIINNNLSEEEKSKYIEDRL